MSPVADPLSQWNDAGGDWQHLRLERQAPRYREIARLIDQYGAGGTVLDLGCGEGVLLGYLNLDRVSQYTGIEPSATAIASVVLKRPQDKAVRTTVDQYQPGAAHWNVIVMSEILYYLQDPVGTIEKFAGALAENGILIISIFQKQESSYPKALVRKFFNLLQRRNTGQGNRRCAQIVESHLRKRGYRIKESFEVESSAPSQPWRFYVVQPPVRG